MAPASNQAVRGVSFEVSPERYVLRGKLGQGAYGYVCAAWDVKASRHVAVKKVKDALMDGQTVKYVLRELVLMKHFSCNENILSILDAFVPSSDGNVNTDLYFATELMDTDLGKILHSKQPLTSAHIQWITYQILRGVKCLHSAKCLHRDLKPQNILINANSDVKIGDLGLARGFDASRSPPRMKGATSTSCTSSDHDVEMMHADEVATPPAMTPHGPLTDYVVTRWYRAPELLVENAFYDEAVDMWAVGCILAECLSRRVLFPGKDYLQQLRLIIQLIGRPGELELSRNIDNPAAADFIRAVQPNPPPPPPTSHHAHLLEHAPRASAPLAARMPPGTDPLAVELAWSLLSFEASRRPSAKEALAHAYLHELRDVNAIPDAPPLDFEFEAATATEADLRARLSMEIEAFRQAC